LCAAIRAGGGLAVLAHPWPGALAGAPPLVAALDAVEVWNTFHHGTYVPNAEALADLRAARQAGAAVVALHGNDFHFADNFRSARLELSLPPGVLGWEHVRTALREGRYRLTNGKLSVGPTGVNLAEIWFLRAMRQAQHAAACLKRRLITPFKPCCWEYLACDPAACCPARIEPNGGQICWRVVGTFTGLDRRGPCCNYLPDCRDCEFYQSRTKQWRGERRRRVLHLIETGNPGGAELMMVNLVGGLDSRRFVSHACLIKEGWLEQKLRDAGVPVAVVPLRRRLNWRFLLTLVRLVRQRRYDVLHSHEFTMNIYAFLIGLLTGVPTVATVHGNIEYVAEKRRRRWLYHVLARLAGPLVAVSEELKRRLVREFNLPAERIAVVPNGVTLPPSPPDAAAARLHRRALGLPEAGPVVGVIGRLHPVKGQDVLLAAWPQVLASHPGACLAVVGQGQSRAALEKTAAALGIASAVVFTGYRDDVAEHLAAFDVVVVPSRYEGLSLLLIEAMAAQRPVVATRVGGNPEAVEDGVSGLLVPAADPSALAAACHRLLDDPALARQLGENARERAERLFSQDTMIRAYERLYETKTKEHA
jgi:glycosyltransferase involved in cell wall biosynthesis